MVQVIKAEPAYFAQSLLAQFLTIIGEPLLFELRIIITTLPQGNAVCQEVPDLHLEIVWSGSFVLFPRVKDSVNKVRMHNGILPNFIQGVNSVTCFVQFLPARFQSA